jgi:hypothetical protein
MVRTLSTALLLVLATGPRPFPEERLLLDRRLETLRRILPDGPNPAQDAAVVRDLAEAAHLGELSVNPRPPMESANRAAVLVEVAAVASFADLDRFFRQVALSPRLVDVESVALTPASGDRVRLAGVVRLPYRPSKAPLPPPPDGLRAAIGNVPKPQAEAFLRDQALVVDKSETIAELRRARRNPRLFLSELAAVVRDRPVVVTRATLGDEFLVSGLTVGEASMRGLEGRFERGFFRVSEVLIVRQGACHRFEVRGRSPVVGPEAEIPLPAGDPVQPDEGACKVDRDNGRPVAVRQASKAKVPPPGSLSLRLRDVDLADVFQVLHQLTGQAFLVDPDVRGRVSVDVWGLDLEGTLAALQRAGARVSGPGPVRRVVPEGEAATPPPSGGGGEPRMSLGLKRAGVRDLLAVLGEAHPPLVSFAPPGPLGRVSLWAKDAAVTDLRAAILHGARLSERVEGERRLVLRSTEGPVPSDVAPVTAIVAERRLVVRPQELAAEEFQLAGLAQADGRWTAFVYSPTGDLYAYRSGDRLVDATVNAVESTDVLLQTEEGPLRVPLPDMIR